MRVFQRKPEKLAKVESKDYKKYGVYRMLTVDLVKDYKRGRLKGKLKEIAEKLKEDDNPVIMLIKRKK